MNRKAKFAEQREQAWERAIVAMLRGMPPVDRTLMPPPNFDFISEEDALRVQPYVEAMPHA